MKSFSFELLGNTDNDTGQTRAVSAGFSEGKYQPWDEVKKELSL